MTVKLLKAWRGVSGRRNVSGRPTAFSTDPAIAEMAADLRNTALQTRLLRPKGHRPVGPSILPGRSVSLAALRFRCRLADCLRTIRPVPSRSAVAVAPVPTDGGLDDSCQRRRGVLCIISIGPERVLQRS